MTFRFSPKARRRVTSPRRRGSCPATRTPATHSPPAAPDQDHPPTLSPYREPLLLQLDVHSSPAPAPAERSPPPWARPTWHANTAQSPAQYLHSSQPTIPFQPGPPL